MTNVINTASVQSRLKQLGCIIVIPTYNNQQTIASVIDDVKLYADDILVVNDGSTDSTQSILESISAIRVVSYSGNQGKGYAIRQGLKEAARLGFRYAMTIDSDGQHFADDFVQFLDEIERHPDSLLIGSRNLTAENMPSKNTFANKFSNFWYTVETWKKLSDTQSGFRLYPVSKLKGILFVTRRYEFEVEVIVRASWKNIRVSNVPIKVYYPPAEERVSHFRPGMDFFRISVLNTVLVLAAYLFFLPRKIIMSMTLSNVKTFVSKHITHSKDSNKTLAISIGLGVFCGIVPVWGYQMIMAGSLAHLLRLNKVIAVLSSNISIPPVMPFVLYGSLLMGGLVLGREVNLPTSDITFEFIRQSMFSYLVGSMILAMISGVIMFLLSFSVLALSRRNIR